MEAVGVILYLVLAPLVGALLDGIDRKVARPDAGTAGTAAAAAVL